MSGEQRPTSTKQVTIAVTDPDNKTVAPPREEEPTKLKRGRSIFRDKRYEVVSVEEKKTGFGKAVPAMPMPVAVILCFFNCVVPGLGTLLTSLAIVCGCPTDHSSKCVAVVWAVAAAILQLATAIIVIGWIWSILWGVQFLQLSYERKYRNKQGEESKKESTEQT